KENELNTDILLEQQRRQLIDLEGKNEEQKADYRGKAFQREAEYSTQALTLELQAYQPMDPRAVVALAMKKLGENAGQIGHLTITSEILAALLDGRGEG